MRSASAIRFLVVGLDSLGEIEWFLMFQAQSQVFAVSQVDRTIFVDIQLIPSATLGLFKVEVHFELVFRSLDARFKQLR